MTITMDEWEAGVRAAACEVCGDPAEGGYFPWPFHGFVVPLCSVCARDVDADHIIALRHAPGLPYFISRADVVR